MYTAELSVALEILHIVMIILRLQNPQFLKTDLIFQNELLNKDK